MGTRRQALYNCGWQALLSANYYAPERQRTRGRLRTTLPFGYPANMHWEEEGIILSIRRHGETSLVAHALTRAHGRHAGLVRGGQGRHARATFQIGNQVSLTWSARLEEHLGGFSAELVRCHAAHFMDDKRRLACLAAAAALTEAALPERELHPRAYDGLLALLAALDRNDGWRALYVTWELDLLAELGFGLDLTKCAATGVVNDLIYVSPRSGQAVSRDAGAPYRDRLLRLPSFLHNRRIESEINRQDLLDGLALTGFFWTRRVAEPQGRKLPPLRRRFIDLLSAESA